jgi:hypothetical protein
MKKYCECGKEAELRIGHEYLCSYCYDDFTEKIASLTGATDISMDEIAEDLKK